MEVWVGHTTVTFSKFGGYPSQVANFLVCQNRIKLSGKSDANMLQATELRSGSARLNELNLFFHTLSKSGLKVLSFSEVCALNP
jgi:hypothetical protein